MPSSTDQRRDLQAAIAVTRFGLGARPDVGAGEIAEAARDPRGWLASQVRREGADPLPAPAAGAWPDARDRAVAWAAFRETNKALQQQYGANRPAQLMSATTPVAPPGTTASAAPPPADYQAARRAAIQPLHDLADAEVLARAQLAAATPAGFRERWTLFWSNHFTVAGKSEELQLLAPVFEREAIRPFVFARFEDLLVASTSHPGMIAYLDQTQSIGPDSPAAIKGRKGGLNENLAREVLELHTVGADAGYAQADVTEFARALTGLSVGSGKPDDGELGARVFRAAVHQPGVRTVMGRRYGDDGPEQVQKILADLATHPATARRLAHKLAAHFVADDPPPALVARLERAYVKSGGDLGLVALALIQAPEAWDPRPAKLKTPYEFIVSAYRAAGTQPTDAKRDVLNPLSGFGQRPFMAPQPNGWPDQASAWAAPDAIVKRLTWAQGFAARAAPVAPPPELAGQVLGARLAPETAQAVARAESRPEAFALLLMSPEFQRR